MRDLATAANVSPTTLYNLYTNKDDLVLASLRDRLEGLDREVRASALQGIEHLLHRCDVLAGGILEMPRYAEAMALMLFSARPHAPIVQILITNVTAQHVSALQIMQELGEVRADADIASTARDMCTAAWSAIMLWTKEIISTDDFRDEYTRVHMAALWPALTSEAQRRHSHFVDAATDLAVSNGN